jgi:sugar lactone lactonase YvrE
MRLMATALLALQLFTPQVFAQGQLPGPDPAQMEDAPQLGYVAVPYPALLPDGSKLGPPSAVVFDKRNHLIVFNRGPHPLVEFDTDGKFVRSLGEGLYGRPHGMRIDAEGNFWTTDVQDHRVIKLSPEGKVLLTLGERGKGGDWNEATQSRLLNQPTDLYLGPGGDIFVAQGHGGQPIPKVLRFDKNGKFITQWGGKGKGPGEFDVLHSIVVDSKGLVYVADRSNRRMQIFDSNGKFIKEWKFRGLPCGLFIAPNGQMWMLSGFSGEVMTLDANGKALGVFGVPGKGLGEFGEAHYMALAPNGDVYVADTVKPDLHRFVKK